MQFKGLFVVKFFRFLCFGSLQKPYFFVIAASLLAVYGCLFIVVCLSGVWGFGGRRCVQFKGLFVVKFFRFLCFGSLQKPHFFPIAASLLAVYGCLFIVVCLWGVLGFGGRS